MSLLQALREISARAKDTATVSQIDDEALPFQKELAEMTIASGKTLIGRLQDLQDKPASSYKKRVPWITSLISSGAMLGWESAVYDSADGWQADVYKADGSGDGQIFTEVDLAMIFEKDHPFDFKSPVWSTLTQGSYSDYYPQIEELCPDGDGDPDRDHAYVISESIFHFWPRI